MMAVCIFGLAALALAIVLGVHLRAVKPKIRDAQLTFSESSFRDVVAHWSDEQLAKVTGHQFIWPWLR